MIAILVLTPVEFVGFLLFVIWVAIVSVLTARRWSASPTATDPVRHKAVLS